MDYNDIKKLIDDMGNANIDELNIEFPEGIKISMKKNQTNSVGDVGTRCFVPEQKETTNFSIEPKKEEIKDGKIVKSPMVGTFYSKPSPTLEPFVEIGKVVKKGDTLCIIEAMKLMNEIESEYDGEIVEVLVKDGDTVEYGTPLFRIK